MFYVVVYPSISSHLISTVLTLLLLHIILQFSKCSNNYKILAFYWEDKDLPAILKLGDILPMQQ